MKNLSLARLVANVALFFDLCDDDVLDPRVADKRMELLVHDLKLIDRELLRDLVQDFGVIASEYDGEAAEYVRDIPYAFMLEEVLAEDDPIRMAELEARSDAREFRMPEV